MVKHTLKILQRNMSDHFWKWCIKVLKCADVIPIFKKKPRDERENYRPVTILPSLSKVLKRCLHKQMYWYFSKTFSKFECGFRKNYRTQQCLIVMKEKLQQYFDKDDARACILNDLSITFDCLPHEFITVKRHAYRVDLPSLKILHTYLVYRKHRICLTPIFSSFK